MASPAAVDADDHGLGFQCDTAARYTVRPVPAAAVTDNAGDELADLLQHLIAFPTESRTPNLELIRWIADHVEASGGRATVLDAGDGRGQSAGVVRPTSAEAD